MTAHDNLHIRVLSLTRNNSFVIMIIIMKKTSAVIASSSMCFPRPPPTCVCVCFTCFFAFACALAKRNNTTTKTSPRVLIGGRHRGLAAFFRLGQVRDARVPVRCPRRLCTGHVWGQPLYTKVGSYVCSVADG